MIGDVVRHVLEDRRVGTTVTVGTRHTPAHHPLCIFDGGALWRWKEVQLPQKVVDQAIKGGFLQTEQVPQP